MCTDRTFAATRATELMGECESVDANDSVAYATLCRSGSRQIRHLRRDSDMPVRDGIPQQSLNLRRESQFATRADYAIPRFQSNFESELLVPLG